MPSKNNTSRQKSNQDQFRNTEADPASTSTSDCADCQIKLTEMDRGLCRAFKLDALCFCCRRGVLDFEGRQFFTIEIAEPVPIVASAEGRSAKGGIS